MKCDRRFMRLYAVTDRSWTEKKSLAEQVREAISGGVTCVQLREKELDYEAFFAEALAIRDLCRGQGVPFIINDNVELALNCSADGVHVGQSDMNASDVRSLIGSDKILGVSVQTVEQAKTAEQNGADYLGVGSIFPTSTKPDAADVSLDTLRSICGSVSIPVCAIGGINAENILQLKGTGLDGVALVSAIFASSDITKTCRHLLKLSEEAVC